MEDYKDNKHPKRLDKGALDINDRDEDALGLISDVIKEITSKIVSGENFNFLSIPLPIRISHPSTILTAIANDMSYTKYIISAAKCTDPLERMKYVLTYLMSGLHLNAVIWDGKTPLNPIMGETLQCITDDGCELYIEQTEVGSYPTCNFYMKGPENLFEIFGYCCNNVKMAGMNSSDGVREGKNLIRFQDGTMMNFVCPPMEVNGLLVGQRSLTAKGSFHIKDVKNKIEAVATFYNKEISEAAINGFKKLICEDLTKIGNDDFICNMTKFNKTLKKKELVSEGFGSWLGEITLDGKKFWNFKELQSEWKYKEGFILPSDSSYRGDILEMKKEPSNYDQAKINRSKLESQQSNDAQRRSKNKFSNKK